MMEKKRSKGITIFCWLIILFGIYSIFQLIIVFATNTYFSFWTKISFYLFVMLDVCVVLCAFKALGLQEWARRYLVLLLALGIAMSLYGLKNALYVTKTQWNVIEEKIGKEDLEYSKRYVSESIQQAKLESKEVLKKIAKNFEPQRFVMNFMIFVGGIPIIWRLLIIFFFTRKKVKEQFK